MMDGLKSDVINPSLITRSFFPFQFSDLDFCLGWHLLWTPSSLQFFFIDRIIAHLYRTHCDALVCLYSVY